MSFSIGENVGPYQIVEKLGQGGMATVYKAYHPALDRYVALKVLHPAFQEDPNFLARFQREARIVAKLDHPNIVPIYDFAEQQGHPYLVMRFIEGQTLKARLQEEPISHTEARQVLGAVGQALDYAHRQGILHRDIKPSNIILTPEGQIYLTDFGLARMAEAGESTLSRDLMVGTPQYISPEQAKGETQLSACTDVYSLGVVLYEILVGRVPYQADTPYAVVHDHIFTPLPLPRSLKPDLPEALERTLLKALAKEPSDRFQSVEEMVAAFQVALEGSPAPIADPTRVVPTPLELPAPPQQVEAEAPVAARPARKRLWLWALAGVAGLICACAIGLAVVRPNLAFLRRQDQPQDTVGPQGDPLEAARSAQAEGQAETALELYRAAIATDPHLTPAYLEAGELLAKMGEPNQALELYRSGLETNEQSAELHQRMAELALMTKRWDIAEMEVEWLMDHRPDDPLSHASLAVLMLGQGKPCQEVHPELDTALLMNSDLALTHYGMALCFLQEGNPQAARAELEFILGQEDLSPLLRAEAEHQMGRLEEREQAPGPDFEPVLASAAGIPDEGLRSEFKEMLQHAHQAWQAGEKEHSIEKLMHIKGWLQEHWEEMGPLAGELDGQLDQLLQAIQEG